MGHYSGQGTRSAIPSCCHWWWSCCCCHCSGSFYVDNVVQSESSNSPVPPEGTSNAADPKPSSEDTANPNIYGNQLDKEALINPSNTENNSENGDYIEDETKPYQENFDFPYREEYSESDRDCDRDSYLERMSGAGSHTPSFDGAGPRSGPQGSYLGSYHRIRHMSGLSEGDHGQFGPSYNYRSDSYSGGSYGSPDQGGGYPLHVHDGRDFRYASMSRMPGSGMDSSHRNDVKQVSSILKRSTKDDSNVDNEEEEEESAYNEHFKNNGDKPGPGEFRVPSVRVRPVGGGGGALPCATGAAQQKADYTGTATEQGKHDGTVSGPGDSWNKSGSQPNVNQGGGGGHLIPDGMMPEQHPPMDRWNLLYLTLVLHGVGTLMPWNIFINAKTVSYPAQPRGDWSFLLPDYFVHYKLGLSYTNVESSFVPFFLQYLALSAQLPNVIFNWINVFFKLSDNLAPRIVWTMLVEIIILIITIVLAMVETSSWPTPFFYLTIVCVIVLNMANGVYQNTVYGLAARLPVKYTGAVVLGSNLSGTIVAIINIVCIAISPNPRTAAIYYFITALFMLLACFDTYFALPLNRFYRYHEQLYLKSVSENKKSVIYIISHWNIFKKCFPQLLNIFLVFTVTLSLFPAVLSDVDRVYSSFFISREYFISLTCFLTFNLCAVIGNMLPSYITWPSADKLWIACVSRLLFIPFFLLCNYRPAGVERLWPVLFHWDGVYWTGTMIFAISGGYTASLALMYCPRCVDREHAGIAGMMGAAALGSGILAGITISCLMPLIISAPALDWELPTFWPAYHPD